MLLKELSLAFLGSLMPSILFNVRPQRLFWVGSSGVAGWLFYSQLQALTGRQLLSIFAGALIVGIYSEILARVVKSPATVFSVSGIFPLVPGIGAYSTVQNIVENNLNEAAYKAIETLSSAGSIAFGILIASALFRILKKLKVLR